jgi:hypothetical protein
MLEDILPICIFGAIYQCKYCYGRLHKVLKQLNCLSEWLRAINHILRCANQISFKFLI